MATDVTILRVLSGVCGEGLQLFAEARVSGADEPQRRCYVCVGRHCLFLVAKEMDSLLEGWGRLAYLQISKAVTDVSFQRLLLLELAGEAIGEAWDGPERLLLEVEERDALLERVSLCWQAEVMYKTFQVQKLPLARGKLGEQLGLGPGDCALGLPVQPYREYQDGFVHRGYSVFLRQGFEAQPGLGSFRHDTGWQMSYDRHPVTVPSGIEFTLHVSEPVPLGELEGSAAGQDDLKTVAHSYKQALLEPLDQFYIIVNGPYLKRMNRSDDLASWEGWEFFIRAKEVAIGCVLLRREFIPPLCDTAQDVAVLLRCPAAGLTHETCEALLDECRFVADSVAPVAQVRLVAKDIIQARLDSLQCTDEGYRWFEGRLNMTPVHRFPAAVKFLKSIVKVLDVEGQNMDEAILEEPIFADVPVLHDPLVVAQEMLTDAESLLGDRSKTEREERRAAWYQRIAKYLAFCVDGGLLGERFTIGTLVQAMHRGAGLIKELRVTLEFLLHLVPLGERAKRWSPSFVNLSQLLQEPDRFSRYTFNRNVLKVLLHENHLLPEWEKARRSSDALYEVLLASFLSNETLGIHLQTLICRQILETSSTQDWSASIGESPQVKVLVPALMQLMNGKSLQLASCATAALVNLSCGKEEVKSAMVRAAVIPMCMRQLKTKDDDLMLYTLYLLVNLTKLPHHRAIAVREGIVPLLVDILTSSYQNIRKHKLLTEVASVIGQLCNDLETRTVLSQDYPVVLCLLWINDQASPNSKLKGKLLFALRQLAASGHCKEKIGEHAISGTIDQIAQARPKFVDCLTNALLLLLTLSSYRVNVAMMAQHDRLNEALNSCGLQKDDQENPKHKFGPGLWDKVVILKERMREEQLAAEGL